MPLAVMAAAPWTFEVVDVAAYHVQGAYQERGAAHALPVGQKSAWTALADNAVMFFPQRDAGKYCLQHPENTYSSQAFQLHRL
jgi:hypothetical protein